MARSRPLCSLHKKVAALANPELGAKQICPNCQTKFYDLTRRPAQCPKCGNVFDPEEAVKSRRVRARAVAPDYDADEPDAKPRKDEEDVEGFEEEVEVTPEIDEVIEADEPVESDEIDEAGPVAASAEPDLGVDFEEEAGVLGDDDVEDVPFLEDEEEDEVFGEDDLDGLPDKDAEDR
jgi:uncharacterized protein (TIGR02300 family)